MIGIICLLNKPCYERRHFRDIWYIMSKKRRGRVGQNDWRNWWHHIWMAQCKIKRGSPWKKVTRVKLQVYRAKNLARLFSNNENEIASILFSTTKSKSFLLFNKNLCSTSYLFYSFTTHIFLGHNINSKQLPHDLTGCWHTLSSLFAKMRIANKVLLVL